MTVVAAHPALNMNRSMSSIMPITLNTSLSFRGKSLIGLKFGRLTVIGFAGIRERLSGVKSAYWDCVCECGNRKTVQCGNLKTKHVNSCGCLQMESRLRHGYGGRGGVRHPLYKVWDAMIQRCSNPKNKGYANYGGRGIKVCEEWKIFKNFAADMVDGWRRGLMIERKNNDEGYNKQNCVWATRKEQNFNKRNSIRLTCNGVTRTLQDWAKVTGLSLHLIYGRMRLGWSVRTALTAPLHKRGRYL